MMKLFQMIIAGSKDFLIPNGYRVCTAGSKITRTFPQIPQLNYALERF